jgi:hypothetical protein
MFSDASDRVHFVGTSQITVMRSFAYHVLGYFPCWRVPSAIYGFTPASTGFSQKQYMPLFQNCINLKKVLSTGPHATTW